MILGKSDKITNKKGLIVQISDMFRKDYSDKVQQLFDFGREPLMSSRFPNYSSFNFMQDDIPELIKLATDYRYDLYSEDEEHNDDNEYIYDELFYASIHAVNILGLLQAVESIPHILKRLEKEHVDNDFLAESIGDYVKNLGIKGLDIFEKYIFDNVDKFEVNYIFDGLLHLAQNDEFCKKRVVDIFIRYIKNEITDPETIATAIWYLTKLTDDEHIELIRETFATKEVDELMCGDLEDIEIELGLRERSKSMEEEIEEMILQNSEIARAVQITKPIVNSKKIGRNDLCPCGSGKKYKKCCMNKEA